LTYKYLAGDNKAEPTVGAGKTPSDDTFSCNLCGVKMFKAAEKMHTTRCKIKHGVGSEVRTLDTSRLETQDMLINTKVSETENFKTIAECLENKSKELTTTCSTFVCLDPT
jgi:hypothetical protein